MQKARLLPNYSNLCLRLSGTHGNTRSRQDVIRFNRDQQNPDIALVELRPASPGQFALCGAALILGIFSFVSDAYTYLKVVTDALLVINVALCVFCIRELFKTKALGKTLLVGSCVLFFWFDAFSLSQGPTPFAVPPLQGFTGGFDGRNLQEGLFSVSLFQALLMVGYSLRFRLPRIAKRFSRRTDTRLPGHRLVIYAFAACGLLTTALAYGFSPQRIWTALIASRTGSDFDWQNPGIWNNLAVLGMFGASYLLIESWTPARDRRIWPVVVGLVACTPFVLGGTRHLVLFIVLPVLAAGITRLKRMTFGRTVGLCMAGFAMFVVLQLQYALRAQGWDGISGKVHAEDLLVNSNGQFSALLFALHLVPAEHDFFHEVAEPYFLLHWVPRAVWPTKPVMAAWTFYNDAYTRGALFNVTPSVIGQFYMNWGIPGVAYIGLWLGILMRFADSLISVIDVNRQRSLIVVAGMLHAFVVASFRYYHPLYFTYFAFSVIAAVLITRGPKLSPNRQYDTSFIPVANRLLPEHL